MKPFDLRNPTPGTVPEAVFDEIVAGTKISSEKLAAALKDHLVHGLTQQQACNNHQVNPGQLSLRLKSFRKAAERYSRVLELCCAQGGRAAQPRPDPGLETLEKQAAQLIKTIQALKSSRR